MKIDYLHYTVMFSKYNQCYRLLSVSIFFLFFLLIGLTIYRDYGISWDEPVSRTNGMITLKYLSEHFTPDWSAQDKQLQQYQTPLAEYQDRDYGVAFETPVSLLERVLKINDSQDIYLFRHLLTFLVYFLGVVSVFRLMERRFADWRLGLLGTLFLVLSPRLFAESFYNSKDAVFMALFAIAMNTSVRFLLQPTYASAFWHALATAIAIDVRIMGIILPAATVFIWSLQLVQGDTVWRTAIPTLLSYMVLMIVLVITFWPYLWSAPWTGFIQALENMSKFRWNGIVLYLGAFQNASDLPWHYIPVWISISTPLFYLFLFIVGASSILFRLVQRRWLLWRGDNEWQDLLFLGLFIGPLLMVIILDSVLYDGWRQMYFIYPAFLLISLRGWVTLWAWRPMRSYKAWSRTLIMATALVFIHTALTMIKAHPYQNVYFNVLAGRDVKTRFEVDYWGLSNRQALQMIIDHDKRPLIKVWPASWTPLIYSRLILKKPDRERIDVVANLVDAEYIVNNYRGVPKDFSVNTNAYKLFHQIEVNGEIINSIFKKK